ncbi:Aminotransferase class IV [Penicillium chermesinum]|uniref:Aminotransferase class IV n=1 Tax=Penicillium chermesinum TaxID=63820 RepID=A0A9W9NZI1_9EURO|nr:Aminotransferase class IV [Penicillium chermesinum]KAJ5232592.1 Aminotransferase class IV [Penicillium chermesinum]
MSAPLDATKLRVTRTQNPSEPANPEILAFGNVFTDHMLQVEWTAAHGWHEPEIVPYGKLNIDPSAGALNYAVECFEGMKAYRDAQGMARLFRPEVNIARFNRSAARVIASPVGSYYKKGVKALTLEATPSSDWVRAWPGGSGSYKVGANYGPCMMAEVEVKKRGSDQVLWLFGDDQLVTEAGTMNLFIVLRRPDLGGRRELLTPPLDGTILPGVNRDCVLQLAREKLEGPDFVVQERSITMKELAAAGQAGNVEEVFGAGTAAIVCPIGSIRWAGQTIDCGLSPERKIGEVAGKMKDWIEARQYGEDEHEWSVVVCPAA